jgi:hypothetical protein
MADPSPTRAVAVATFKRNLAAELERQLTDYDSDTDVLTALAATAAFHGGLDSDALVLRAVRDACIAAAAARCRDPSELNVGTHGNDAALWLFADIIDAKFDLLTYRKNDSGTELPALPGEAFTTASWTDDRGRQHQYDLADTTADLTISKGRHKGRVLALRQVTRRKPGRGGADRQVHILTTREPGDLPAAAVACRMTSRWREENYFRYARSHFALDALDSYATIPDDPQRLVPNPAKKTAAAAVKAAKNAAARAQAAREQKLAALHSPAPGTSTVITNKMLARLDAPVHAARASLAAARAAARATPAKIPLSQHNPGQVLLDTETKLITHAIRMAACNAETILARALHGHYARAGDEAFALIREALAGSGDIIPAGSVLHVRLDPLTAPRRTRALQALCQQLNTTQTRYPGTTLTLRYEVKEHPGTA